ncbi:hypothetical protein C8R45DRAFT_1155666 [Mycena sanguinolenta]|nr:hypothetical protein C8R45DRAFT_1155666 [Mycena sanguinolenta]
MELSESRLPNELWAEILKNVSDYHKSTAESFSLTCRVFCGVSRPRLFSRIDFTSYVIGKNGLPLLPSPSEIDRRIKRLDFVCSAEIAPLVRECHIQGQTLSSGWYTWSFSTGTPYILLDALFERLARFTGLQRLYASQISFTQARVDILFRLLHLSQVHVSGCTVTSGESIAPPPRALHVSDFHLWHYSGFGHREDYWIPLLHPDHLRVLSVALNSDCIRRAVLTTPTFPNVHTLTASTYNMTLSQNLTFLSRFPGVRILRLWGDGHGLDLDAVDVEAGTLFPHLAEYYGPCQPLPLFLASTNLRRMQIDCSPPEEFLSRIQGLNLTSLHATLTKLDNAVFNKIVEFLPHLAELLLIIDVGDLSTLFRREIYGGKLPKDEVVDGWSGDCVRSGFTVSTFFLKLSSVPFLPPGLERLAIHWKINKDQFYDEYSAYKLPNFPYIRDVFRTKCPALTWLSLDGIFFMLEWQLMSDGTVDEYIGKNFHDGGGLRQSRAIFWDWDFP